jgi:hypothetical protein
MNRILLGALAALLLVASGTFWWQGRAATERGTPPPVAALASGLPEAGLPTADGRGLMGAPPPEADEVTREQRRFDRLDRNRDGIISRSEMLAARAAAFRALDVDHNNLLSFEEWAVRTSNRFKAADRNGDQRLTREEFATTKPKRSPKPACRCPSSARSRQRATAAPPSSQPEDGSDDDAGDPEI